MGDLASVAHPLMDLCEPAALTPGERIQQRPLYATSFRGFAAGKTTGPAVTELWGGESTRFAER